MGIIAPQSNKAALSAQQTVELSAIPSRRVELAASELQSYIDAMPRLLTEKLILGVTGDLGTAVEVKGFYGPGDLTIVGSGKFTLQNALCIEGCSIFVYIRSIEFQERAGMVGNGLLTVSRSGYVYAYDCDFTGLGAGSNICGVKAEEGSPVLLGSVKISNCMYAVLAGNTGVLSIDSAGADTPPCEFSGNAEGAYVWNGGIVLLGSGIPDTLGGAANRKFGGIIAKADGTLL